MTQQHGLRSCKQPPPISNHLGLTFWLVAYERFDSITSVKGQKDNRYQLKVMDIDIGLQNGVYVLLIRLSFSFRLKDFRECCFKFYSKSSQIAVAAKQMLNLSLSYLIVNKIK